MDKAYFGLFYKKNEKLLEITSVRENRGWTYDSRSMWLVWNRPHS